MKFALSQSSFCRLGLSLSAIACCLLSLAQISYATDEAVPGQFIVKFAAKTPNDLQAKTRGALGVRSLKTSELTQTELVEISSDKGFNIKLAKDLLAAGAIEYIEPNYIYSISKTANDPSLSSLWGLDNSGNVDIDASQAWDITTGNSEVVVGVVDTGIDFNHPDLAANIWVNPFETANGIDDDGNGVIDDLHGFNAVANNGNSMDDNSHGTHVAGTIGAVGNNGVGVTGVAWNVKLMGLKFLSASGSGTTQAAIDAINYAVRMKNKGINIRVLNNSWGGSGASVALRDAISAANAAGILFTAAAGNNANDNDASPTYPANYDLDNIISIAAVDRNGNLASFSNYGRTTVDVAAPGVGILSTLPGNRYGEYDGTSMATPFVSGVAALLFSSNPGLSSSAVRSRITKTTKPLATLNGLVAAPGIVSASRALNNTTTPAPMPGTLPSYKKSALTYSYDRSLGTRVHSSDDGYKVVAIDFAFPYYGKKFNRLALSANGRIIPLAKNEAAPTSADFSNKVSLGIAPYNDDLFPSPHSEGGIYFKQSATKATITWVVVSYADRNSSDAQTEIRFQTKLYASGNIEFHYEDTLSNNQLTDYGASASIGIAPPSAVAGEPLTVSHNEKNQKAVGNKKAIKLSPLANVEYTHADFDGDARSDLVVYRESAGLWLVLPSKSGFKFKSHKQYQLGLAGDIPLLGDFDGDKKADMAVWRPTTGTWFIRYSKAKYKDISAIQWGLSGDVPLAADYDGDGKFDLSIYRPSAGAFFVLLSSSGFNRDGALGALATGSSNESSIIVALGGPANDPIVGDFSGNGKADFVTVWQLVRFWTIKNAAGELLSSLPWGAEGDTPLACRWDVDAAADRAIVRVNQNFTLDWYVATSSGAVVTKNFGSIGDTPHCNGDYDGDGRGDMRVFRNNSGEWFIKTSKTSKLKKYQFGLPGDIAL